MHVLGLDVLDYFLKSVQYTHVTLVLQLLFGFGISKNAASYIPVSFTYKKIVSPELDDCNKYVVRHCFILADTSRQVVIQLLWFHSFQLSVCCDSLLQFTIEAWYPQNHIFSCFLQIYFSLHFSRLVNALSSVTARVGVVNCLDSVTRLHPLCNAISVMSQWRLVSNLIKLKTEPRSPMHSSIRVETTRKAQT